MRTRASLCELLAIKMLRHFSSNYIELVAVLTTAWDPLQGASDSARDEIKDIVGVSGNSIEDNLSALEVCSRDFIQLCYC